MQQSAMRGTFGRDGSSVGRNCFRKSITNNKQQNGRNKYSYEKAVDRRNIEWSNTRRKSIWGNCDNGLGTSQSLTLPISNLVLGKGVAALLHMQNCHPKHYSVHTVYANALEVRIVTNT